LAQYDLRAEQSGIRKVPAVVSGIPESECQDPTEAITNLLNLVQCDFAYSCQQKWSNFAVYTTPAYISSSCRIKFWEIVSGWCCYVAPSNCALWILVGDYKRLLEITGD